jgi:hypothetical protein
MDLRPIGACAAWREPSLYLRRGRAPDLECGGQMPATTAAGTALLNGRRTVAPLCVQAGRRSDYFTAYVCATPEFRALVSERITPKTRGLFYRWHTRGLLAWLWGKPGVSERDRLCVHKARGWGEFRPVLWKSNPNLRNAVRVDCVSGLEPEGNVVGQGRTD